MKYATKRLINSVWTVAYTVGDDGRATIHGFGRSCDYGYESERALDRCNLAEGDGRVVQSLVVHPYRPFDFWADSNAEDATTYEVTNPDHVFSYGEAPEPPRETTP